MLSLYSNELARRSTWTCLSCSALSRTSQALISSPAGRSSAGIHQRKHSSSKTSSSPKDEPTAIATPSEAPAKEAKPGIKDGVEKRSGARVSKRKSKDGIPETAGKINHEMALNLPSVPSTQHLHPSDIHVASFFSTHRPISVTTPIPQESSGKAFSSIFDAKPGPKPKTADVIYTISSAVDTLESVASNTHNQSSQQMTPEEFDLRTAVTQASPSNADPHTHNLDIPAKTLHINLQELAKNFRPFVPPPAPVPMSSQDQAPQKASNESEAQIQPPPKQKSFTTTLTIHETTYPNGRRQYKTSTTPIVEDPAPSSQSQTDGENVRYLPPAPINQPFLGRMRQRQIHYEDRIDERIGGGEVWRMISVKRQRKLKMKKHKYKKLMKRTKNLRRRLDRT
ncbi:hypothetical protein MMC28_000922 [Mycoblastus sanguinarius]|nr:hypothetical protein [Mycoblastus sanguinarius]